MAGHSKWAGIKHKKAIVDSRRGKLFTKLARHITVAAKSGGGDVVGNPSLALAVQKAKDASMPKDNIQRAIDKGTGAGRDARPSRTSSTRATARAASRCSSRRSPTTATARAPTCATCCPSTAGNLGEPGSVAYLFDKKGVVVVSADRYTEDDLIVAVDAGAEDIEIDDDVFEVLTEPADLQAVRAALEEAGVEFETAEVLWRPKTRVEVDEDTAGRLLRLIDALDDNDDVDEVHANFDAPADVLERVAS
jgi:transcriptional/translational regulatory protein YebC/TACO1